MSGWLDPMILEFNTISGTLQLPIYDVSGTYRVDWGDGSGNTVYTGITTPSISSTATNPTVQVQVKDDGSIIGRFGYNNYPYTWTGADKLTAITQWGDFNGLTTINRLGGASLDEVPNDLPSTVTNTSSMFLEATNFNQDISKWDVGEVTNMQDMFRNATKFNQNLGAWDVSEVTTMSAIFFDATIFNQDISKWKVGNVTDMGYMFFRAYDFNQNLGAWDVSNVTKMWDMFYKANSMSPLNVSNTLIGWNALPTVVTNDIQNMISGRSIYPLGQAALASLEKNWSTNSNPFVLTTNPDLDISYNESTTRVYIANQAIEPYTYNPSFLMDPSNATIEFSIDTTYNALPPGIDISLSTGIISGTPTSLSGVTQYRIDISGNGHTRTADISLSVIGITYEPASYILLENTTISNIDISSVGVSIDSYTISPPTLPADLSFNTSTGAITGTTPSTFLPQTTYDISGTDTTTNIVYPATLTLSINYGRDPMILKFVGVSSIELPLYDTSGNYSVDWGDGVPVDLSGNTPTNNYSPAANPTVKIYVSKQNGSKIGRFGNNNYPHTWDGHDKLRAITQWGNFNGLTAIHRVGAAALDEVPSDLPSTVTNMSAIFFNAIIFNQDIGGWDVSKVTNMRDMFRYATNFNQDISKWDVSEVTNMGVMFGYAINFNQDISKWKVGNVTNMGYMFYEASNFNQNLGAWDVSKVDDMQYMFYQANDMSPLNLSKTLIGWNALPIVVTNNIQNMLSGHTIYDSGLTALTDLKDNKSWYNNPSYNASVPADPPLDVSYNEPTTRAYIINQAIEPYTYTPSFLMDSSNAAIEFSISTALPTGIDISLSTGIISGTPTSLSSVTQYRIDISGNGHTRTADISLSVIGITYEPASYSFIENTTISNIDISSVGVSIDSYTISPSLPTGLDISASTGAITGTPTTFQAETTYDISGTDTTTNIVYPATLTLSVNYDRDPMILKFVGVSSIQLPLYDTSGNYSVDWGDGIINNDTISHTYTPAANPTVKIYVSTQNGSKIGRFGKNTFPYIWTGHSELTAITQWGDFNGLTAINRLGEAALDEVPSDLPSTVTNTSDMFSGATNFNDPRISNWDVGGVGNMNHMFLDATNFNQDISKWDVSNVTTMYSMFLGASNFNQDISKWDVGNVENMRNMFYHATNFNQDISKWNVGEVTNMQSMFQSSLFGDATKFNQNIGAWNVSNVTNMQFMFQYANAMSPLNLSNTLIGWNEKITATGTPYTPNDIFRMLDNSSSIYLLGQAALTSLGLKNWSTDSNPTVLGTNPDLDISYNEPTTRVYIANQAIEPYTYNPSFLMDPSNATIEFSISSLFPALPSGIDISLSTGIISGTPTSLSSSTSYTINITGNGQTRTADISLSVIGIIYDPSGYSFEQNTAISSIDISSVGVSNLTYTISPSLPTGLDISASTGAITGTTPSTFLAETTYDISGTDTTTGIVYPATLTLFVNYGRDPMILKFVDVSDITLPLYDTSGNYSVDWGDGDHVDLSGDTPSKNYVTTLATATVKIYVSENNGSKIGRFGGGTIPIRGTIYPDDSWDDDKLTAITQWGDFNGLTTINRLGSGTLTGVPFDLPSTVTDTSYMFYAATNFDDENIVNWDVSKVMDMPGMFSVAQNFNQDISKWNVGKVEDMENMFSQATIFNQDISKWNVSKVTTMQSMFSGANKFNQDISKWKVGEVTTMPYMFNSATDFNQDIGAWDVSKVTDMRYMFQGATDMSPLNLSNTLIGWNALPSVSPNSITNMLYGRTIYNSGLTALTELSSSKSWTGPTNYSSATADPSLEISYNESTTRVYIANQAIEPYTYNPSFLMDPSNATIEFSISPPLPSGIDISLSTGIISGTPTSVSSVTQYRIDISGNGQPTITADISLSVIGITYEPASYSFIENTTISTIDISSVGVSIDSYTISPPTLPADLSFNTSTGAITGTPTTFQAETTYDISGTDTTTGIVYPATLTLSINYGRDPMILKFVDVSSIELPLHDTSGNYSVDWGDGVPVDLSGDTPYHAYTPTGENHTVKIYVSENNGSKIGKFGGKDVYPYTWDGYDKLNAITQWGDFNGLTTINRLGGAELTGVPNDLPSTVTNTSYMFRSAPNFNQDIGTWDVGEVTDMHGMFRYATNFNQDISKWDVSKVMIMNDMFYYATNFNQDISKWKVSEVTNMANMFGYAINFNQNLAAWDVSKVTSMRYMFSGANAMTPLNLSKTLIGWNALPIVVTNNIQNMLSGRSIYDSGLDALVDLSNNKSWINNSYTTPALTNLPLVVSYNEPTTRVYIANKAIEPYTYNPSFLMDPSNATIEFSIDTTYNALPSGIDISLSTGIISGTPTSVSSVTQYRIDISGNNETRTADISLSVIGITYEPASYSFIENTTISSIDISFVGVSIDSYTISPSLPTGLDISASTGAITGTPTTFQAETTYDISGTDTTTNIVYPATLTLSVNYGRDPMILKFVDVSDITLPLYDTSGNYSVDWGDGDHVDLSGNTPYHAYSPTGENHTVKIYVSENNGSKIGKFGNGSSILTGYNELTAITQWGDFNGLTTINRLGAAALNEVPSDLPSTVTNTSSMFFNASNFNQDIGAWNVSNVTDMRLMFANASIFNQDISKWDVSNVTDMHAIISTAQKFNQNLGAWDVGKVEDMQNMFTNLFNMSPLNLSATLIGWNSLKNPTPYLLTNIIDMLRNRSIYQVGVDALNELIEEGWNNGDPQYILEADYPILNVSYNEPTTRDYLINTEIYPYTPALLGSYDCVSFSIDPSNLIVGLELDPFTGVISGTPTTITPITSYQITTTAKKSNSDPIVITSDISLGVFGIQYQPASYTAQLNVAVNDGITFVTRGVSINSYTILPTLPADLSFNTSTGAITGTPTALQTQTIYAISGTDTTTGIVYSTTLKLSINYGREPMILTFANVSEISLPLFDISGDYTVDWGAGVTVILNANYKYNDYSSTVNPTVKIYVSTQNGSSIGRFGGGTYPYNNWIGSDELTAITQWGDFNGLTTIHKLGDASLNQVPTDLPSTVINTSYMFYEATNFDQDIGAWDVSEVTTMIWMFYDAINFNQDISKWDVSKVVNMYNMFSQTMNFNQDISKWNVSEVTNMYNMFYQANKFNQDIGKWNVSKVTTMQGMFEHASNFNQNLGAWDVSNVTRMDSMFYSATSMSPLNLSNTLIGWNEKITGPSYTNNSILYMLKDCDIYNSGLDALVDLSNNKLWYNNPSYSSASADPSLDISYNESTMRVYIANQAIEPYTYNPSFLMNSSSATIDFSISPALPSGIAFSESTGIISGTPTDLSGVTSYTITILGNNETRTADISLSVIGFTYTPSSYDLYQDIEIAANEFITPTVSAGLSIDSYTVSPSLPTGLDISATSGIISGTPTKSYTEACYHISGTDSTTGIVYSGMVVLTVYGWRTPMKLKFNDSFTTQRIIELPLYDISGNYTVNWGDGTSLQLGDISHNYDPNDGPYIVKIHVSTQNGSKIGKFGDFGNYNWTGHDKLTAITQWGDFNGLTTINFLGSSALVGVPNDLPSTVTNTNSMFYNATNFDDENIVNWDVSRVTNMEFMFNSALNFNKDISKWDVSEVTTMSGMFIEATNFNQDISKWKVGNVKNMGNMFFNATKFNQNLGAWDVSNVTNMSTMFFGASAMSPLNVSNTLIGWNEKITEPYDVSNNIQNMLFGRTIYDSGLDALVDLSNNKLWYGDTNYTTPATADPSLNISYNEPTTRVYIANQAIEPYTPSFLMDPSNAAINFTSSTLPSGLSLAASTGIISGTPTSLSGVTQYTIDISGNGQPTITVDISLSVIGITYTPSSYDLYQNIEIAAINPTVSAGLSIGSYTISPALPTGLTISATSGIINGTPTIAQERVDYIVTGIDSNNPNISYTGLISLKIYGFEYENTKYAFEIYHSVALSPSVFNILTEEGVDFSITPTFPSNLDFSGTSGIISGIPVTFSSEQNYTIDISSSCLNASSVITQKNFINDISLSIVGINYGTDTDFILKHSESITIAPPEVQGNPVYFFRIEPDLPNGLSINPENGGIQGTPTEFKERIEYIVTGKTDTEVEYTAVLHFTVIGINYDPARYIVKKDVLITDILPKVNGITLPSTNAYAISDNDLPDDIVFGVNDGKLSGTPTVSQNEKTYTITATDVSGATFQAELSLKVFEFKYEEPIYRLEKDILLNPTINLDVSNHSFSYFDITPLPLPNGLNFSEISGEISGTPDTAQEAILYTVKGTDNENTEYTTTISLSVWNLSYSTPNNLKNNSQIAPIGPDISGITAPSYDISGAVALPSNLSFNTVDGTITGRTDTLFSEQNYTITVTDNLGYEYARDISLSVIGISYSSINNLLAKGETITNDITPTTGGISTPSYSINPSLPSDLSFNTTSGIISGTPDTISAKQNYTITARANEEDYTADISLNVYEFTYSSINNLLAKDVSITNITPTADGISASSYSISTTLPSELSFNTTSGIISGTPDTISTKQNYTITVTSTENDIYTTDISLNVYEFTYSSINNILEKNETITDITPAIDGISASSYGIEPPLSTTTTGLDFSGTSGIISGKPDTVSTKQNYTITVTSTENDIYTTDISLNVYEFNYSTLTYLLEKDKQITDITPVISGVFTPSYSINPELSTTTTGLDFSGTSGIISGTPTTASNKQNYTITASSAEGDNYTTDISLNVYLFNYSPLTYLLEKDKQITDTISPTVEGITVEDYVSETLPSGLSISKSSGEISGTPDTAYPKQNYTITLTSNVSDSYTTDISLNVYEFKYEPVINRLKKGEEITDISPAIDGITPDSYTITGPVGLPADLSFNTTDGTIFGTPESIFPRQNYTITAAVGSDTYTTDISLNVYEFKYESVNNLLKKDVSINDISPDISGITIYSYSINPILPNDLSLNATTGIISGKPTEFSLKKNYTITVTDDEAHDYYFDISLNVYEFKYDPVINRLKKDLSINSLNENLISPDISGITPDSYKITGPALPTDLSFNTTDGTIFGTPETVFSRQNYTITVYEGTDEYSVDISLNVYEFKYDPASYIFNKNDTIPDNIIPDISGIEITTVVNPYDISGILLPDLSFNTTTGQLSGQSNTFFPETSYTITVTDDENIKYTTDILLGVTGIVYDPAIYKFKNNESVEVIPIVSGEITNPSYSITPSTLPAGLDFSGTSGIISGTPDTLFDEEKYTITATASGEDYTTDISLSVIGIDYDPTTYSFKKDVEIIPVVTPAFGGITLADTTPYDISGALPGGLNFSKTTGTISGTPASFSAEKSYTITATDTDGVKYTAVILINVSELVYTEPSYTLSINVETIDVIRPTLDTYDTFEISPALPEGLDISGTSGIIDGTPTVLSEITEYTITAQDDNDFTYSTTISISVIGIVYSPSPPIYRFNKNIPIIAPAIPTPKVVPELPNYLYSIIGTSLPNGIVLSPTDGTITGTPLKVSPQTSYTVRARQGANNFTTDISLNVYELSYPKSEYILDINVTISPLILKVDGITDPSFTIDPALPPDGGLSFDTANGIISGKPTKSQVSTKYTITATESGTDILYQIFIYISVFEFTYTPDNYSFTKKIKIDTITPYVVGATITSYAISNNNNFSFPPGLIFSKETGEISGTPSNTHPKTQYTITATISTGVKYTRKITIRVVEQNKNIVSSFIDTKSYLQSRCLTYKQNISTTKDPNVNYFTEGGVPINPSNATNGTQNRNASNCFNNNCNSIIYKPNNTQYAQPGGVSSSSRMSRLKYNTLNNYGAASNSASGAKGINRGRYQTEPSPSYQNNLKPQQVVVPRKSGDKNGCPPSNTCMYE